MEKAAIKSKLIEHGLSLFFVSVFLLFLLFLFSSNYKTKDQSKNGDIQQLLTLEFVDLNSPFHRALLKDAINIFYPGQYDKNNAKIDLFFSVKEKELRDKLQTSHLQEKLSGEKILQLLAMYAKFILIYLIVMILTYYGVQTLAIWRFCRKNAPLRPLKLSDRIQTLALGIASFILFCPAYVIAYSIRTELNTDTALFMTLLCVISNGLLMVYANKFFNFLVSESRKGYVETALVKNLNSSYSPDTADGISYRSILSIRKHFTDHVFNHIYKNARFQYFSTLKEQASFLITGMIITEMALNIHGHLSYEMLRQLLYKNYDIVLVIILGIFYVVKMTEIFTDYSVYKESLKYENKGYYE